MNLRLPHIEQDMLFDTFYTMSEADKSRVNTFLSLLESILYYRLTPAGKRLFKAVWAVSSKKHFITRRDIARQLMREKGLLVPYDVKMLNQFVTWGLLDEHRRARPLKNGFPTGYEIVYTMPHNVKWGCKRLSAQRRAKSAATENPPAESGNDEKLPPVIRWGLRTLKRRPQ